MTRKDFSQQDCSVARCLSAVGDTWSFLIVRDAMFGIRRFSDFERSLGIAKNILRNRLQDLLDHGILEKVDAGEHGPRFEYRLTAKGRDLFPVMIALRQWADRWEDPQGRAILVMKDAAGLRPLPDLQVRDADGKCLQLGDVTAELPAEIRALIRT